MAASADVLYRATDVGFDALLVGLRQTDPTPSAYYDAITAASVANLATAAARNGQLLGRLDEVMRFRRNGAQLRRQVRGLNGRMRLPHAGVSRTATYAELYVMPPLRPRREDDIPPAVADLATPGLRTVILGAPGAGKSTRPRLEEGAWEVVGQIALQLFDRHADGGATRALEVDTFDGPLYQAMYVSSANLGYVRQAILERLAPPRSKTAAYLAATITRSWNTEDHARIAVWSEAAEALENPPSPVLSISYPAANHYIADAGYGMVGEAAKPAIRDDFPEAARVFLERWRRREISVFDEG